LHGGKVKKVALMVCVRKLLTMLNAMMIKHWTLWDAHAAFFLMVPHFCLARRLSDFAMNRHESRRLGFS